MSDRGEPIKWITWKGRRIPIYEEGRGPRLKGKDNTRDSIKAEAQAFFKRYWKGDEMFVDSDVDVVMRIADDMIKHLEGQGKELLEPSADYPDEIVWKFSGKDKETGEHASFEFDSKDAKNARENLKGNGYTVSQGLLYPKNIFDYLMDQTNVEEYDRMAMDIITKALLKGRGRK